MERDPRIERPNGWWDLPASPPTPPTTEPLPLMDYAPGFDAPRAPQPEPEPPSKRARRTRAAVALVVIALVSFIAAGVGVTLLRSPDNSAQRAPTVVEIPTTLAPTRPSTPAPSTPAPSTQPPSTSVDGGSGTSSVSRDELTVGVVNIEAASAYQRAEGAGTGIVLNGSGQVLTNNHVIEGSTSITVEVVATGKSYKAKVVGTSPTNDVALLQLENANGITPARFGSSEDVKVGDAITAVGNAGGRGTPTFSRGSVVALDRTITASDGTGSNPERLEGLIQINAQLMPGQSGGPLFDADGKVVGINTAASANFRSRRSGSTAAEGYAIPIDHALSIAREIQAGRASNTITIGVPAFLGISSVSGADGVKVTTVVAGAPAEKAGVEVGDTITSIDGKSVTTTDALVSVLRAHKPGDRVKLTWTNGDGTARSADIVLAEGPA